MRHCGHGRAKKPITSLPVHVEAVLPWDGKGLPPWQPRGRSYLPRQTLSYSTADARFQLQPLLGGMGQRVHGVVWGWSLL